MKNKREELIPGMTREEISAEYDVWRQTLIDGQKEQDDAFDKHILAFSAGSFGVSFAFIDKVVPLASAVCRGLLIAAWTCFAFVLILELIGFRVSSWTYLRKQFEANRVMELRLSGINADYKNNTPGEKLTKWQNRLTLFLFIGGMICLILFTMINLL